MESKESITPVFEVFDEFLVLEKKPNSIVRVKKMSDWCAHAHRAVIKKLIGARHLLLRLRVASARQQVFVGSDVDDGRRIFVMRFKNNLRGL